MTKRRKQITLRELINQLESFSCNGEFDDTPVTITDEWTTHSDIMVRDILGIKPYHDELARETYIAIDIR